MIEAVNGGTLSFPSSFAISGGSLNADSTSTISFGKPNGKHELTSVTVNNAGTFQLLLASLSEYETFNTSGGLINSGTARLSLSGSAAKAYWTFNSGTTLNNAPGGTFIIENTKSSATAENYVDIKAGATFASSGTIVIVSTNSLAASTNQLRSAINLISSGTITVDGAASSIKMSGYTLTQTAGKLDVKNGGSVVATSVAINAGTLAGNGTITGDATLAGGVTRAWSHTDGVAGAMTVSGTLTLPATATVSVSGSGAFPSPATVFTAASFAGAASLSGWTVTGAPGYVVKKDGNSVVLAKSGGGTIILLR